jgi:hypothetical protein
VVVNKRGIPKILSTDKKGANKFVNDLENNQKLKNRDDLYVESSMLNLGLTKERTKYSILIS